MALGRLGGSENEHAIATVLMITVGPGNAGPAQRCPQDSVYAPADGNLMRVGSSLITESLHVHHDNGSVHSRPRPDHVTMLTHRCADRNHPVMAVLQKRAPTSPPLGRSEEHTSELQSQSNLVC